MNIILTHATEEERCWKQCKCSKCGIIAQCTPDFDFYTPFNSPDSPLVCERCTMDDVLTPKNRSELN